MINYSMLYQEINILQWSSDQGQVSNFQHWKIAIDVNKDFNTSSRSHRTSPGSCNFVKKETLAQVFFCESCKMSKNTFYWFS